VLSRLPRQTDPNVLVGFDTYDDAGVYQLSPEQALVQTVDILTPIADDPSQFGQIAAANSLSDVYAMGGRPLSALSIVCFPAGDSPDLLETIMLGGLEKMGEAGCAVISGHSVRDEELKFGYAVTGLVHPARIWRNKGARAGDILLLTKPLGTGVLATALKQEGVLEEHMAQAIASMARLNREAAEALHEIPAAADDGSAKTGRENAGSGPVHAVTDITGFGLLGHAREMAAASGVSFEIEHGRVPLLPGALEAARGGYLAGGLKSNREFIGTCVGFRERVPEDFRNLFFDPQTSGGLLVSLAAEAVPAAMAAMERRGVLAQAIGRVVEKTSPLLLVV
jgi:selenide,water dikinase